MRQVIQNYSSGMLELADVSVPVCSRGKILVRNAASLISIGTERSVIELGKKSLFGKARARPDLLKRALDKAKKEGFQKTFQEAMGRLDTPNALGYSCAGIAEEIGEGVDEFSPGDRVACIGAGFASHAEYVSVPKNLCALIPDGVGEEEAAFGMIGIIALHGVRTADVDLGECVAVVGLGLLGQISVQLLKASGCKVIASDLDPMKIEIARKLGCDLAVRAEELTHVAESFSKGNGVDSVIITASSKTSEPIEKAAQICRFGGKVVLVGVCDIQISRQIFWEKEIRFQVSRAGGAGIFDPVYELEGVDYPIGLVRWTEKRNLETVLDLMKQKKLLVDPLITHRFGIEEALTAYEMMMKGEGNFIGVILHYPQEVNRSEPTGVNSDQKGIELKDLKIDQQTGLANSGAKFRVNKDAEIGVGVIGGGLFGKALMLPVLAKINGISLKGIATATGITANHIAKKYKFDYDTTDYLKLIEDPAIEAVLILTKHHLHSGMIIKSLEAGKHVFVEKPLCINEFQLSEIMSVYDQIKEKNKINQRNQILMVGYNRRYAPLSIEGKQFFDGRSSPLMINSRINAGFVPKEHWVHDPAQGGGRIIGEVCHFVDLTQYWTGSKVKQVYAQRISGESDRMVNTDNVDITLKLHDGSVGHILYTAAGDKAFSRERYELFCDGSVCVIEDFKEIYFTKNGKKKERRFNQDLGYQGELTQFFNAIRVGGPAPVSFEDYVNSTLATLEIMESLHQGRPVEITPPEIT